MRKQQSPQDILNEILLRMNYDSSKTLSENEKLLKEQSSYAYGSNVGSWMNATEKQGAANDPYEYKKEAGTYYYRKKGSTTNWIATTGAQANAIATKIFGDKAPFVITTQTQTQDPNVYPGPRKTTLSSYSSGSDGEDTDLINSSLYPQYKYNETDPQRQLQTIKYLDLKREAYQKIIELLRDEYTTKEILQSAWNKFMLNYKMLYRDKDQWEDYRTLLKLINNSKKFEINSGKVDLKKSKQQFGELLSPGAAFQLYMKKRAEKVKKAIGQPEPIKPEEPRDLEKGDRCGDQLYAPKNPPLYYYNSTTNKSHGPCWYQSEYNKMIQLYDSDFVKWEEEMSIWNEANGGGITNAQYLKTRIPTWNEYISTFDDDIKSQRDVTASYHLENRRNMYGAMVGNELRKWDIKVAEQPTLLWEAFLWFRSVWNNTGTQLLATAAAMSIPETGPFGPLAAMMIEIGIDALIAIIDLIDCMTNPDDEEAWKRFTEDLTGLFMFGGIGLIARALVSKIAKSQYKRFSDLIRDLGKELYAMFEPLITKVIKHIEDTGLRSKFEPVRKACKWLISKLKQILDWLKSFVTRKYGAVASTFLFESLPVATATFLVLIMNEERIVKVVRPLLEPIIGFTIENLQEIATLKRAPTEQEEQGLRKIELPENVVQSLNTQEKEDIKNKQQKSVIDKLRQSLQKINDEMDKDPTGQSALKTYVNNTMRPPCQDYFKTLLNKNKLRYVTETKNGIIVVKDDFELSIGGVNGYYLDVGTNQTKVKKSYEDGKVEDVDCISENEKELEKEKTTK